MKNKSQTRKFHNDEDNGLCYLSSQFQIEINSHYGDKEKTDLIIHSSTARITIMMTVMSKGAREREIAQ